MLNRFECFIQLTASLVWGMYRQASINKIICTWNRENLSMYVTREKSAKNQNANDGYFNRAEKWQEKEEDNMAKDLGGI